MRSVETVLLLVAVATVVAAFANRLAIPAPSLLVAVGVVAGLVPGVPTVRVSPEVISLVVLPPLLYASGEELSVRDLRAVWRPVAILAVGLVLVSAVAVAFVAAALTPLSSALAFVLGAILASTDPVAVTALARRLSLPPRMQTLVQAESLFNDATSLLLYKVALSVAVAGGATSGGKVTVEFVKLAAGGAGVGAAVAAAARLVRRRVEDPQVDTVISLVTPYAAYVIGEGLGTSGVTAVVVTAVILGTQVTKVTNAHTRIQRHAVYETLIFLLESTVFGLIGLQLPVLVRDLPAQDQPWVLPVLGITATLVATRFLGVFPLSAAAQLRGGARLGRRAGPGEQRLSLRVPVVISWSGTRGVVPLAAALSLPLVTDSGAPLPDRGLLLVLVTGTVVITLLVQGFTLAPMVAWAGVAVTPGVLHQEDTLARIKLARAALARLDELTDDDSAPPAVLERLRGEYDTRLAYTADKADFGETPAIVTVYRLLRRDLIEVEQSELDRLHADGEITDRTRRKLQRMLDLEDLTLGGE
ncbi:Na+/H+ antiporter [Actinocrinis puniceicyclus]|uniref:Na+/H+ antiporter n=1 Tax=Actinocrinis puniceicyclus TaxID=977794 RepID=A0A8J7WKU3_9ACTN|nr:Na+/H+ antiporter [Actinocrinis puniceicyclus]MBS2961649.1 Na+/H+ antiporter [Actinocrinis puniceicyclus]